VQQARRRAFHVAHTATVQFTGHVPCDCRYLYFTNGARARLLAYLFCNTFHLETRRRHNIQVNKQQYSCVRSLHIWCNVQSRMCPWCLQDRPILPLGVCDDACLSRLQRFKRRQRTVASQEQPVL
jgi:hypothetical protein